MLSDPIMYRLHTVFEYYEHEVAISKLEGYLFEMQGFALMVLAEQGPAAGAIVEIGSFKGKSTCWLAKGSKKASREKVFAVDTFAGSPEHQQGEDWEDHDIIARGSTLEAFRRNIAALDVADYVEIVEAKSADAAAKWNRPIRLLFIDADHSYEASKLDFNLWSPQVVRGGLICMHDVGHWPGVTEFYVNEVKPNPMYREVLNVLGMPIVEKLG